MSEKKYNCFIQIGDLLVCSCCKQKCVLTMIFSGRLRDFKCGSCNFSFNCQYNKISSGNYDVKKTSSVFVGKHKYKSKAKSLIVQTDGNY